MSFAAGAAGAVAGGFVGFAAGGPVGAMVGAAAGVLCLRAFTEGARGATARLRLAAARARRDELSAKQHKHPLEFSKLDAFGSPDEYQQSVDHFIALQEARMKVVQEELRDAVFRRGEWDEDLEAQSDALMAKSDEFVDHSLEMAVAQGTMVLAFSLAKADGEVTRDEFALVREALLEGSSKPEHFEDDFQFSREADAEDYRKMARELTNLFGPGNEALAGIFDSVWAVAAADGEVHPREEAMLADIAQIFVLSREQIAAVESVHRQQAIPGSGPRSAASDYRVLGISPEASDDEVQAAFRSRVRECHPDTLVAKGAPRELVTQAGKRMAAVNAAYARIKEKRGF